MIRILGISGNMGAGKSILSQALAENFTSTMLAWDDFDEISNGPKDYIDWFKRGENYDEWHYPELVKTLETLKSVKPIVHPVLDTLLEPTKLVVFDAPAGRLHQQTGVYIDIWIHIEVPLDVSLCRWLLRDHKESNITKDQLLDELEFYLKQARPLFDDKKYKSGADFVVDGMLPTEEQVRLVKEFLKA